MAQVECTHAHLHHKIGESLGYVAWHQWAKKMSKTHVQEKCPGCGLYKIWRKK